MKGGLAHPLFAVAKETANVAVPTSLVHGIAGSFNLSGRRDGAGTGRSRSPYDICLGFPCRCVRGPAIFSAWCPPTILPLARSRAYPLCGRRVRAFMPPQGILV